MAVDVAELGIKVDSSGVTGATKALNELGVEAGKTETKVEKWRVNQQRMMDQLARFEQLMTASLAVQNQMAASLDRLGASTTRVGDAADRLRAKYDPLAAAGARYSATLKEIDKAQQDGILSSQVASRARQQELIAYNNQIATLERLAQTQKAAAQAAVNKQTIVPDRGADIAAYGAELDKLRAKYNPLFAAGREYRDTLTEINQAAKIGAITERERSEAIVRTKSAFSEQVASLRNMKTASAEAAAGTTQLAAGAGLARHELINLSRQAQDVVVSLQGGQGLGTVALQQGSQIIDVFVSSKASIGDFFTQAAGWAGRFATSMVGAFVGVTGAVVGGAAAFISYRNAQEAIQLSLMGIGRASGVTAQQLNEVGKAASSLTGLSTSEATEFATALAATGRVAQESLLPATQTGKNLAKVLGTDIATAAQIMGQALTGNLDPINARLGAFSYATQEQIKLLFAQNRETEAQAIITRRVTEATAAASDVTAGWSKAWTALGNAASNAWTAIGRGLDAALGMNKPIADQYKDAIDALDKLKAKREEVAKGSVDRSKLSTDQQDRINFMMRLNPAADQINKTLAAMDDEIAKAEAAAGKLKTSMDTVKTAAEQTKAAMQSIADAATSAALAPEIAARKALTLQTANATSIAASPTRQAAIGISQAEADEQVKRAKGVEDGYRTAAQKIAEGFDIANKAITAFSPKQKAEIAQLETAARLRDDPTLSPEDKRRAAQEAYNIALKQGTVALSEQARARALSAQQAVDSVQNDINMVGKSIGQQAKLRADLQSYQALQQQAAQSRTGFDNAEYARLQKINEELGRRAQMLAEKQLSSDIKFGADTAFLSDAEKRIASILRQVKGDDWKNFMKGPQADALRLNAQLEEINRTIMAGGEQFVGGFVNGLMQGKSIMESLQSSAKSLASTLASDAVRSLFKGDFVTAGIQAAGAAIFSLLGDDSDSKHAKEVEKAREELAKMTDQIYDLGAAAKGIDLGPLTNSLRSLFSSYIQLGEKAREAEDWESLAKFQATFNTGVVRLTNEFANGAQKLSPLESQLKAVNDEAAGLADTLSNLGLGEEVTKVMTSVAQRLEAVRQAYKAENEQGLRADINTASGVGYLNDITTMLARFNELAASGVIDPNLLTNWLKVGAQKIVSDSELVGSAFSDVVAQFPQLAGLVTEFSSAIKRTAEDIAAAKLSAGDRLFNAGNDTSTLTGAVAAAERQYARERADEIAKGGQAINELVAAQQAELANIYKSFADKELEAAKQRADQFQTFLQGFTRKIGEYLDGLRAGSSSPLSPQARLAAAQSQYNTQLALGQGGDQDALNGITQYSSDLLEAAKAFYGSSSGFQTIFAQIQSQLGALPSQVSETQQIVNAIADMKAALSSAIQIGDSVAIANALAPKFSLLTSTTGGLMTFGQFSSLANGLASNATLQQVFNELDTNGDGQISRLELIRTSTGNTDTNLKPAGGKTAVQQLETVSINTSNTAGAVTGLNTPISSIVTNTNGLAGLLSSIVGNTGYLSNVTTSTSFLPTISSTLTGIYSLMTEANGKLQAIRQALNVQSSNWGGTQALPQFMVGGYTGDMARNQAAGVVHGQEYVSNAFDVSRLGVGFFDAIRAGGTPAVPVPMPVPMRAANDDVVRELRALKAELAEIKKNTGNTVKATMVVGDHVGGKVSEVKEAVDDSRAARALEALRKTG